jgi:plastocyanin
MRLKYPPLCLSCLGLWLMALPAALCRAEAPATQPVGQVMGRITAEANVPMTDMVVYLESPDSARVLPVPKVVASISQKGATFSPALLIVCVGQTVAFLNDEPQQIEHNVFSNAPAKRFDLGLYKPGESRSVFFDKPGPVFIYCSVHRHMDGVVFVSPTPFFCRIEADGQYRIIDVPPGNWVLKTWQRRRRFPELSLPIIVEPGKTTSVDMELRRP